MDSLVTTMKIDEVNYSIVTAIEIDEVNKRVKQKSIVTAIEIVEDKTDSSMAPFEIWGGGWWRRWYLVGQFCTRKVE